MNIIDARMIKGASRERDILLDVTQAENGDTAADVAADAATRAPAGARDATRVRDAYRPGYERVAEQILELIARSHLRPGDRMPTENEIAGQLGTSRTVVREAIKILSALGRIKAQKGRGLYVADDDGMLGLRWEGFFLPADLDHVYMLFEFRRVQEAEASPARRHQGNAPRAAGHRGRRADLPGRTRDGTAGPV